MMLKFTGEQSCADVYDRLVFRHELAGGCVCDTPLFHNRGMSAHLYSDHMALVGSALEGRFSNDELNNLDESEIPLASLSGRIISHELHEIEDHYTSPREQNIFKALCGVSSGTLLPSVQDRFDKTSLEEFDRSMIITNIKVPKRFRGINLGACLLAATVNNLALRNDLIVISVEQNGIDYLKTMLSGFHTIDHPNGQSEILLYARRKFKPKTVLLRAA